MIGDTAIAGSATGDSELAAAIVVSTAARELRRELRPLVWMVLEEVALDAVAEGGRLVARTSARRIAERLTVDPGSAAGALRLLRDRGLLALEREAGPAGRFGLAVYVLGALAGVTVRGPCGVGSSMAEPRMGLADVAGPDRAEMTKPVALPVQSPQSPAAPRRRGRAAVSPVVQEQRMLDFGLGTTT